ncbi:Transposase DDE domain protein [Pseudovibrio axinellae]|uniref:Transposase DDE domain protein n=3 Tax=Pseudovibrio axinellae TaxID=989403 RepID=A0A165SVH6_9HYPH|nr:Transposase DDE domain protein [Pseudovibrio axinellae]
MRSLLRLMKLDLAAPDFSTLSRRAGKLEFEQLKQQAKSEPVHLVVDSTGLKVFGAGEWQENEHGTAVKRLSWRKLHLGMNLDTSEIVCSELTEESVGDPTLLPDLLDQIEGPVSRFIADEGYDGEPVSNELQRRFEGVEVNTPPPKNAVVSLGAETNPTQRDRHIAIIQSEGRMAWQKQTGYTQRSRIETQMGRFKQVIGNKLKARNIKNQRAEIKAGVNALNKMTILGRPAFERVL